MHIYIKGALEKAYSAHAQFKALTSDHAGHNLRRKCERKACLIYAGVVLQNYVVNDYKVRIQQVFVTSAQQELEFSGHCWLTSLIAYN